jgi:uncharacterized membrane protein YgdD (TMEM256/DUF423 family)
MFAFWGATSMAVVVGLGAFGAHGLKAHLSPEALGWWHTGVLYQALHALGLFAVDRVYCNGGGHLARRAGLAFGLGTLWFSGSLYAMALTDLRKLGMVTPLGGTAFIVGWICLAVAARRLARRPA